MAEEARAEVSFIRFSLSQRVQHILLIVSFTLLCLTGLPQRYCDADWARGLIFVMGGLDTVRLVHHLAGIMLLFQGLYHIIESVWECVLAGFSLQPQKQFCGRHVKVPSPLQEHPA